MVIFLYGGDTYRSRRQMKKYIEDFKDKRDRDGFNVSFIDVENTEEGEIFAHILSSPFLGEKRLCVLTGCLSKGSDYFQNKLADIIKENKLPETNILLIWEAVGSDTARGAARAKERSAAGNPNTKNTIRKNTKPETLFEILKKQKYALEFPPLSGAEFIKWIKNEARDLNFFIEEDASKFLGAHALDCWEAAHVLNQAAARAAARGAERITLSDVQEFLEEKESEKIFDLVDAILQNNGRKIFKMLDAQLAGDLYQGELIALLARQIRTMLQIKEAGETSDLAEKIGAHPFVVRKLLPLARKTDIGTMRKMHNELVEIDFKTKTGGPDFKILFALFAGKRA